MILEQRSRPTSDGQIVVPMSVLEDVLGALGCVRRSLLPKHRQALNVMERRVGEYDISAVVAVCDFFKKRLSSVEQAAIFRLRDRLLDKSRLATPETGAGGVRFRVVPPTSTVRSAVVAHTGCGHDRQYADQPKDILIHKLVDCDTQIEELKRRIAAHCDDKRSLRKRIDRLEKQVKQLEKDISEEANQHKQADLQIVSARDGGSRLKLRGLLSLGIRRNFSNIAQADLGIVLLDDRVNRFKVSRAEMITADLIQSAANNFYVVFEAELAVHLKDEFALSLTMFSADETGSAIFENKKMSTCIVKTQYYTNIGDPDLPLDDIPSQRRVTDVLVSTDGTAGGVIAMLQKHLASVGCPDWLCDTAHPGHYRIFLYVSDRGSNQECARKIIPCQILWQQYHGTHVRNIFASTNCTDHAGHLTDHDGLKMIDSVMVKRGKQKFYSSITKGCHLARQHHKQLLARIKHEEPKPPPEIVQLATTLMPLCDGGRWGAKNLSTARIQAIGVERLYKSFVQILQPSKDSKGHKAEGGDDDQAVAGPVDDISLDHMKAFKETRSRWAKDVLTSWKDPWFNFTMAFDLRHSEPVEHLRNYTRKELTDADIKQRGRHLARLVTYKGDLLNKEYQRLFEDGGSVNVDLSTDDPEATAKRSLAAFHLIVVAGSFHRRILWHLRNFPLLWLRFGEKPAHVDCGLRRKLAVVICELPESRLEMLSFMLKRLFAPQIAECAATGKLDQRLYVIIVAMRREWQCSVAPNEGLNSVIKRVHGRARHLSKRLLSSRLVIKGVLEKTQASKHNMTRKEEITNQKALGTSVMQTCLDVLADTKNKESHHRHALDDAIVACDRYDQPPAAELRLQDHETTPNVTDYFNLDLTEAHISMGSDLELLWRRTIVSSLGLACPCAVEIFVPAKDDTKEVHVGVWIGADTLGYRRQFLAASALDVSDAGCATSITTTMPPKYTMAALIFARYIDGVKSGAYAVRTTRLDYDYWDDSALRNASLALDTATVMTIDNSKPRPPPRPRPKKKPNGPKGPKGPKGGEEDKDEHDEAGDMDGGDQDAGGDGGALPLPDQSIDDYLGELIPDEVLASAAASDSGVCAVPGFLLGDHNLREKQAAEDAKLDGREEPYNLLSAEDKELADKNKQTEETIAQEIAKQIGTDGMKELKSSLQSGKIGGDTPKSSSSYSHDDDMEMLLNSSDALGVLSSSSLASSGAAHAHAAPRFEHAKWASCWYDSARTGASVLKQRCADLLAKTVGQSGQLVLLELANKKVTYVHGLSSDSMMGWYASIDSSNNSVKAIVHVGDRRFPTDYSGCQIIHPAIGIEHERIKDCKRARSSFPHLGRPRIPEDIVRLSSMWQIANGTYVGATSCEYCGQSPHNCDDNDEDGADHQSLITCWLCTMTVHHACADTLATYIRSGEEHGQISKCPEFRLREGDPFLRPGP